MSAIRSLDALRLTKPELAVFVSGVASMGLEILAGRMIAPQFGSSIYTWGSIIGVFLAALSYGYHRGGKLAAERATNARMARVFLLTGAYVAGLIFLGDLLLRSAAGFPLPSRFASLPAITLLFGPPTFLLGYVSPYAAQLSAKEGLGEASGHVYALGTVGSIVGAFATTYFLVPALGINQIALVFGLLSVGTALVLVRPRADGDHAVASALVAIMLLAAAGSGAAGLTVEGQVVYETQTPYQELRVVDSGEVRTLYLDGQRHSAMDLEEPYRHVFDYTRYFHLPLLMTDEADDVDRVLFVGGGGFTGPKRFVHDYPNVTVDVVEIDPAVVSTAKRYFSVEESERLNIYTQGGRQYLRETNRTYDLIVLDAYRKDKVPFELTTVEFMELTNDRLDEDGVLFANLISAPSGPASEFYRAEYATISRAYPEVYAFPTVGGTVVQNIEVVATKDGTRLTEEELLDRNAEREIGIDLSSEIRNYREAPPTDDVPVLRDDRAPVDSLLDPMVGQRYVLQESNESNESDGGNATAEAATDRPSLAAPSLGPAASAETPWTPAARDAATVAGGST
ncbi:spermidine synthase [Halogeometricum luteum]|uniref:Polyamine aminopropyltransferase n=1 Tax=Halogeometricum luteum TaxID=2950537 RepID=A0ABU2G055_9EURY|nr:fused MFS/spermidine synthase [Halogeometricum sp. S3BR5-2]MDS0294164.1 fused MFS/spermidine synthase [Halogeometricum sp. S3BR5-2]